MIKKTNIDLSISPKRKNPLAVGVQLSSYDKNFHKFEISFLEKELKESDTVNILTVFESSERVSESTTEIRGGSALFSFDTALIDRDEVVTNYIYLKSGDSQAEIGAFRFDVKLSEIDNGAKVIAKAYDESYETLIQDFEKEIRAYLPKLETMNQEESIRQDEEVVRKLAEADRVSSEDTRVSAESVRITNESARKKAETERTESEEVRELAEFERITNEEVREQAENERESKEEVRTLSEAERLTSETSRINSENERLVNETDRIDNEGERSSNEEVRANAESQRELNEDERISNEQARELNEAERISKDSERDSKIEVVEGVVEDVSSKVDSKANKYMFLSPKYDLVYDSCVRDVDTPLNAYSVPMESGHYFVNVGDRDSDTVLTYEPDGVLLALNSVRQDFSPVLIEDFDVEYPYFDVRAKNRGVTSDVRLWFIKYKDKDNWVGIRLGGIYQETRVITSVEGIETDIAVEDIGGSVGERQARPDTIYSLKAEIIEVHVNFAETRRTVRVFKNEQWVFTVPIPTNAVDFPNRVGFSVGSQTEILNFKAGRSR